MILDIPYVTMSINKYMAHWGYKTSERKRWHRLIFHELHKQGLAQKMTWRIIGDGYVTQNRVKPVKVRFGCTIYRIRKLDSLDNLKASLKPVLDALKRFDPKQAQYKGIGLIYDDNEQYLEEGKIEQVKVKHKKDEHTVIILEQI